MLDWSENASYFGGQKSSNFPLVQGAYLCECGTHVIFDAGFWPYAMDENNAKSFAEVYKDLNNMYARLSQQVSP